MVLDLQWLRPKVETMSFGPKVRESISQFKNLKSPP
ncbi:hypothetical protein [Enterobacter phage 01_vB_Eclo_IJM]|nr:hypothetical protein [Enterobacter phage 01_vB_Eclo_IJM]